MGLGKTLTMISLILKHRELEEEREIQNGKKDKEEKEEREEEVGEEEEVIGLILANIIPV